MIAELRDSDIIMGFTTKNLIGFWDKYSGFHDVLFDKINNRTPFYLQFSHMWELVKFDDDAVMQYSSILDKLKIYPTQYKVRGLECFDGCFTDYTKRFVPVKVDPIISTVFEDGDDIWIDDANLMTFGEGNTALLKSSDRHLHINSLDFPAELIDYEKHSPLVIRKTENHFGYLASGTFFMLNFNSTTNPKFVGQANITAISKIVRDLQSNVRVLCGCRP